jgi:hypothetical protein
LAALLSQQEGGTLEFKREWYRLEEDPKQKELQKAELVKDILSLANGSVETAGETAVLIVGASDVILSDGSRQLFDVGANLPKSAEILAVVRSFSSPPMDSLQVIPFQHRGTSLFALLIPPTPHVYEITKELKLKSKTFSRYSVFVRRGDSVDLASAKERDALSTLKRIRMSEVRNPPPSSFGGAVGATTGGILLGQIASRERGVRGALAGGFVGSLLGAIFGTLMGMSYELLFQRTGHWRQEPARRRAALMGLAAAVVIGTWIGSDKLGNAVVPKTQTSDSR